MKKVIFLDIDGVVNNGSKLRGWDSIRLPIQLSNGKYTRIDFSVENIVPFYELLRMCNLYNYKIVLSSSWRTLLCEDENDYEVLNKFIDETFNSYRNTETEPCIDFSLE